MDQERLTNQECSKLGLPGREPVPPHDEIDWYPIEMRVRNVHTSEHFQTAATILGDGAAA